MNLPPNFGQIRDQAALLAPPFLNDPEFGQRFVYAMSLMSDLLLEKAYQSTTIRIPGAGDASQIPYLADDRVLVQGPAEPDAGFIRRLQNAFPTWRKAGSRPSAMGQLQDYLQGLQPGVAAALPEMVIVGGNSSITTWDTLYQGSPLNSAPYHTTISPANWNWDGTYKPWRSWLILYMAQVLTGLSGSAGTTVSAAAGSLPGGQIVQEPVPGGGGATFGVWVPATSGTPVNSPWMTVGGLTGLTAASVGQWLNVAAATHAGNVGTFPIVQYLSATSCVIANPAGVTGETAMTWTIGAYPYIGPGPVWGTPGVVFGQGENTIPPLDFGSNVGGVWQPTPGALTSQPSISWGLNVSSQVIQSIRSILKRWKGAGAYYPRIIVAFDGLDSTAGSAYSPNSSQGAGNPDGTFGGHGKNVAGVWVPNGQVTSPYDAWCAGTGSAVGCTVENVS